MAATAIAAFGLTKRYRTGPDQWIDAVRDTSFEIERGNAVGLIGRNGAGKSTLLKLLSRVTRPTAGHADLYGRVGALLEVGTGFHPDLSGRENTYLSGAILGLSKSEVRARFEQIVAFAEIDKFIDMPVKHYSSGMFARLGFAVAAHLRPEILIIDEVLAVGDLPFQAKCLALMSRLTETGTTVLFVSHNLLAISDFCPRTLVMAEGRLAFDGPTSDAVSAYRNLLVDSRSAQSAVSQMPATQLRINGRPVNETVERQSNDSLHVELVVDQARDAVRADVELNLVIEMADGRMAIHLRNDLEGTVLALGPGRNKLVVDIDDLALAPGTYTLWLRLVGLRTARPVIWDTERLPLIVVGDQRRGSIVQPRHRFTQVVEPDPTAEAGELHPQT